MHGLTEEGKGNLVSGAGVAVGGNDFDGDEGVCLGGLDSRGLWGRVYMKGGAERSTRA